MASMLLNDKKTHGYAILPWLPYTIPTTDTDRTRARSIAISLVRAYSKRQLPPRITYEEEIENSSLIEYYDFARGICCLTRYGLEHFLGFRLEL